MARDTGVDRSPKAKRGKSPERSRPLPGAPGLTSALRVALLAGYGVATFLSFPHPVAGGLLDLGLVVSWLAPALLVLGLSGLDARRAARWALISGWLAHSAVIHWIYVVTVSYGHAPPLVGVVAPLVLGAYMGAFIGVFGAIFGAAEARGGANPWLVALAWTVLDHARSFVLTGFPWATLGYAQHENSALLGLAPFTAVYGLSFAVALGGASLAAIARAGVEGRRSPRGAWAGLACVALLHGVGALAASGAPPEADRHVRVAALQGNIDQGVKWSPDWRDRSVDIYAELARQAAREGAEWIVFPESAIPGLLGVDEDLRARLSSLARETGALLLVGSVGVAPGPTREETRYYDSAFLFGPDGALLDRYDKTHLVPFGEYVPFRELLGRLIGAVARGIANADVSPGEEPRALSLPIPAADGVPGARAVVPGGVPICYELLFPDLVRRFVGDGAGVLLAITNDAWYGKTGAPYQFLAITALRSAETGVWTVRAANTGVSAIIDGRGRVREQTPIFERDFVVADVPISSASAGTSFYVRYGDVFAWSAWLGLAIFAWRLRARGRIGGGSEA